MERGICPRLAICQNILNKNNIKKPTSDRAREKGGGGGEGKKKEEKSYRGKVIHPKKYQIIEHLHKLISASWCLLSARLIKDNLITPAM